ncbi:hypothetical protein Tco_0508437 [Tanacetum coccineum]
MISSRKRRPGTPLEALDHVAQFGTGLGNYTMVVRDRSCGAKGDTYIPYAKFPPLSGCDTILQQQISQHMAPSHYDGNLSSKTKILFSQTAETASRLTLDAVTTTPVTGSHQPRRRQTPRLYLIRRSLEVLRKFHWMILGGRSNQLSHVSSPLLSKPGEY